MGVCSECPWNCTKPTGDLPLLQPKACAFEHWPWQPVSWARHILQAIGIGNANQLPFFPAQENPAKLSDQQEAVSRSQNPYPIYASVNVRTDVSGDDFAGACVWGQWLVGVCQRPGCQGTDGALEHSGVAASRSWQGKDSCSVTMARGNTGVLVGSPGDISFTLGPQSGASLPPTRSASPSMGLMFPPSSSAQSSSWGDC